MVPPRFWISLIVLVAGAIVSLLIWNTFLPESSALSQFTFWCIGVFTFINILAYYAGKRAVYSKSKYRFVQLIMILILFKMMICVALVVAHVKINHPDSKLFVLPFLTIYLIFTLFEIYVLEKLARTNTADSSSLKTS